METVWKVEPRLLEDLVVAIPEILKSQKDNGQFGTEPWNCQDQHALLALAAAWKLEGNPYHHLEEVLDAIISGGNALIEAQDEQGMWIFRNKDYSEWGQIFMPWTYSRWIRTYQIVREAMNTGQRLHWESGLRLGFEGISRTALESVHNISAHHAMSLYCAGQVFAHEEWMQQASAFMARVVAAQSPHGWWSEHHGPVVAYNFVYCEALGVYYAMSGDETILEPLERATRFHANYIYPDGSLVETVDERNPYCHGLQMGNPGFSHTASGRGFLRRQHALHVESGECFDADYAASMLLYGGQGAFAETAADCREYLYSMEDEAAISRQGSWFISLSAYTCPPSQNRWIQDRQNLVSIFHDRTGLIIGGGNTKLQPLWSSFTVGDTALLAHTSGDEDPMFQLRGPLFHVPEKAAISADGTELELKYGEDRCKVKLMPKSETEFLLIYEALSNSGMPVAGHIPLLPGLQQPLVLASGERIKLGKESFEYGGDWIEHAGWRLSLPGEAHVVWPVLPHNPYCKTGDATLEEARLVAVLPFSAGISHYELQLHIEV